MQGADRFRVFFRKSSQIVYEKRIVTNGHVLYNKDREIERQQLLRRLRTADPVKRCTTNISMTNGGNSICIIQAETMKHLFAL